MKGRRATGAGLLVAVAAALAACGPMDDSSIAPDVARELERGRSYARALVAPGDELPTVDEAIAAGYLERLRLGLGSPFRLIEHSLQDPRLEKEVRERLAWSLLARTLDGDSYRIDPRTLAEGDPELAARHLALIEGAIRGSADPNGGVLAVRLAYAMATSEATVSDRFRARVYRIASLVGDRVESQEDARRLLRAAGNDTDPLALLTVWRVERLFDVEQPMPLSPVAAVENDAIDLAPRLLESMRDIHRRPHAGPLVEREEPVTRPLLGPEAARLLALESAAYDAPPQTPVTIATRTHARLESSPGPATDLFYQNAVNEERLAAEYAVLAHADAVGQASRRAVLSAAVGLRAYNQERPWFPGFDGPARRDLEDRFGLASISFPDTLPAHWRPYYRRMLESALSDLQRVMPSLDVKGLHIRFESRPGSPGTLAVHDPRTRTVYIPPSSGAGTIAHEIAHDMDWQTALRRYRVRGDYGTDRAVRLSDERLASVLRGLTAASLTDPVPDPTSHAGRPAEVFARSVDWFVAVALARDGRVNGYLSSVQDDVLTGYGTVTPPDVTGTAGQALMGLLDEVAPVYPETRRWFLGSFGRLRAPTAYDLVRRLVEPPLDPAAVGAGAEQGPARVSVALDRLDSLEAVRDTVLSLVDGSCRAVGYDNGATAARRRLIRLVTEARARSIALDAAHDVAGRDAREWLSARLEGRTRDPAPADAVVELLGTLVDRVDAIGDGPQPTRAMEATVPATTCGPLPFLAD